MRARLGINNCFAVKRWPRPDDWASIVRDELGLDIVELSLDLVEDIDSPAGRERAAGQIGSALGRHGLRAETVFTGPGVETLLSDGDATHAPVRLCLDVGHQCVPGTTGTDRDPYAWLAHFGGRLGEVQLQQSDGLADRHWPFTPERNEAGRIDPGRVLETLAGAGAQDVLLVLEVIPAFEQDDEQVLAELRTSAELWKAALTERGMR